LFPDGEVVCGDGKPAKSEHIAARLGHMPHLLPSDFVDHQSGHPSGGPRSLRCAGPPLTVGFSVTGSSTASKTSCVRSSKASSCNANVASASFRWPSSSMRRSSPGFMAVLVLASPRCGRTAGIGIAGSCFLSIGCCGARPISFGGDRPRRRCACLCRADHWRLGHRKLQHGRTLSFTE